MKKYNSDDKRAMNFYSTYGYLNFNKLPWIAFSIFFFYFASLKFFFDIYFWIIIKSNKNLYIIILLLKIQKIKEICLLC